MMNDMFFPIKCWYCTRALKGRNVLGNVDRALSGRVFGGLVATRSYALRATPRAKTLRPFRARVQYQTNLSVIASNWDKNRFHVQRRTLVDKERQS